MKLNEKELSELREKLRLSIGNNADTFTKKELNEFGSSLLQATAVVLKSKYLNSKLPL